MKIYKSITELIGKTPLFEVSNIEQDKQLKARVLIKLEYFNPAGSVKDRAALRMIEEAERQGKIQPGALIIEPGRFKRIPDGICHAGDNERGAQETSCRVWRTDRAD